jgi:polyisoprenoid-binding protein YceI
MAQTEEIVEVEHVDTASTPPPGTYEIDPHHTSAEFVARHMLTKVRGAFPEISGTIQLAEKVEASSVEVELQTATLNTNSEMRDEHLRGDDFFSVETYPTIVFKSTGVRLLGGTEFELDGDLTVRDVTRSVTLKGEFLGWGKDMSGKPRIFAEAKTTVEREAWNLNWNMAVEASGILVGKKVDLELQVQAFKVD